MSVVLRKRKNNDGTTSILLDIYHNGKRSYEFLKELKLLKPASAIDREENKQRLKLAAQIRNKKEQQLQSDEYDITADYKKGIDFIQFFEKYLNSYNKKDKRVISACFKKFKEFMVAADIKSLSTKKVNEGLANDFKEFLENSLKGETPANYFKKFKKVLKHGVREKIFVKSPADEINIKRNDSGIKKDILDAIEIQMLSDTPITNEQVKRAFLFSCNTGLRFCDVKVLQWKHIQGAQLKIIQQKTDLPVSIPLNRNAQQIIGNKRGEADEFIFSLPSHTACLKNLKQWCKKAKITKHITWHCGRHSFGTNMIIYGGDSNTVKSNMGHSSLVYTQRYVRAAEELKQRAVDNLPEIKLTY